MWLAKQSWGDSWPPEKASLSSEPKLLRHYPDSAPLKPSDVFWSEILNPYERSWCWPTWLRGCSREWHSVWGLNPFDADVRIVVGFCNRFDRRFRAAQEKGRIPPSVGEEWAGLRVLERDNERKRDPPDWLAKLDRMVPRSAFNMYSAEKIEYDIQRDAVFRTGQSEGWIPRTRAVPASIGLSWRAASFTMTPAGWQQWIDQNVGPRNVPDQPVMWLRKGKWSCCEPNRVTTVDGYPIPWVPPIKPSLVFEPHFTDPSRPRLKSPVWLDWLEDKMVTKDGKGRKGVSYYWPDYHGLLDEVFREGQSHRIIPKSEGKGRATLQELEYECESKGGEHPRWWYEIQGELKDNSNFRHHDELWEKQVEKIRECRDATIRAELREAAFRRGQDQGRIPMATAPIACRCGKPHTRTTTHHMSPSDWRKWIDKNLGSAPILPKLWLPGCDGIAKSRDKKLAVRKKPRSNRRLQSKALGALNVLC